MSLSPQLVLYATPWCGQSARARRLLDKEQVAYHYVDISEDQEGAEAVMAITNGSKSVPTLVLPDGSALVEPSHKQIRQALGLPQPRRPRWWPF